MRIRILGRFWRVWWYKAEVRNHEIAQESDAGYKMQDAGLACILQNKIKVEVANPLAWFVEVIRTEDDDL